MSNQKERLAVYFTEEERQEIERWYEAADCKSQSQFIREAVRFYIDYLKTGDAKIFLPLSIGAAIDGKLGSFEDRIGHMLFKQSVELDMLMRLMAYNNGWRQADIEDLRRASTKSVRATNGTIRFQDIADQLRYIDGEADP